MVSVHAARRLLLGRRSGVLVQHGSLWHCWVSNGTAGTDGTLSIGGIKLVEPFVGTGDTPGSWHCSVGSSEVG